MRIRIIDAFTDRPFAGNPAAVCLLDSDAWPDEAWLRRVAIEMNLSETAFAHPLPGGAEADWALRWLTPTVETKLCGHATLATTHALRSDGRLDGAVRYSTLSGVLRATTARSPSTSPPRRSPKRQSRTAWPRHSAPSRKRHSAPGHWATCWPCCR